MRWLDTAWWNYFRQEYPDRFALCCGVAAAVVGLGGYASVSAFVGGGAAGDYGVMSPHAAVTQVHSMPLVSPAAVTASTLGGWFAQGLEAAPAQSQGASPSTGDLYVAGPTSSQPGSPQQSGSAGSTSPPSGGGTGTSVVTTVVTSGGTTTQVSVTTTVPGTTTTVPATTTQGGVTLPTPVTTVTVPITVPQLP